MPAAQNAAVRSVRLMVGLEIHVELATRSKMFTRAGSPGHPDFYDREPNSLVTPTVAALPGTLPVMNRRAVEMSMMVGLALGCSIARRSKWDRKNYYYPDLPKGYQISQYDLPLCHDGAFELPLPGGATRRIGIIRAHLEEDTGKLGHELPGGFSYEGSLVDLNRAGTPLLEIVTAPDFDSADDVVAFAQELRGICRFLGVTEGIMQKGHMRFEPNINVIIELEGGGTVKTPVVEVKNLNSFKALKGAIEFEAAAQVDRWREDGRVMGPGAKSTRGWDDLRCATVLQREKEDAHDYRYFPDPDLVPVTVDDAWLARVRAEVPELPHVRRARFVGYGLEAKDAAALVEDREPCLFFEQVVAELGGGAKSGYAAGKFLLNQLSKRANELGCGLHRAGLTAAQVAGIVSLRESGALGAQNVDALVAAIAGSAQDPKSAAEAAGLLVVRDDAALDAWVDQAIAANAQAAADVRAGKMAAIGRIVGAVMKLAGGTVDAKTVNERIVA
ncbi:MAG: Asp-tRNA(Asn)/Glu-tRNA(Gln) amidotransferase subunit GatB, partial [Phycisphaerales bacterium]